MGDFFSQRREEHKNCVKVRKK